MACICCAIAAAGSTGEVEVMVEEDDDRDVRRGECWGDETGEAWTEDRWKRGGFSMPRSNDMKNKLLVEGTMER